MGYRQGSPLNLCAVHNSGCLQIVNLNLPKVGYLRTLIG